MKKKKGKKSLASLLTSLSLLFVCSACQQKQTQEEPSQSATSEEVQNKDHNTSKSDDKKAPVATYNVAIQNRLDKMSLEEKVGQLIFARVPSQNAVQDVKRYQMGGYMLFDRDVQVPATNLIANIKAYQAQAKTPLLIASDEEGGSVSRLSRAGYAQFLSPKTLYANGGFKAIHQDINVKTKLLKRLGIQMPLAPVADVCQNANSFMAARTFSADVTKTAEYVKKTVTWIQEDQLAATLKHFPGYGDAGDSHIQIIADNRSKKEIQESLLPFKEGIQAGADSVLVSHNIIQAYDANNPASLSPKIHELLRKQLNFKGLIMTDDMDMQGVAALMDNKLAAIKAIKAGNDMIITSHYAEQIPALVNAVKSGEISQQRLNEAVVHVLELKYKLGLMK